MSRNRPRPRDNGMGNNEEMELWTRICSDIHKSKEKFEQQASLSVQIKTLVDRITREGNSEYSESFCFCHACVLLDFLRLRRS